MTVPGIVQTEISQLARTIAAEAKAVLALFARRESTRHNERSCAGEAGEAGSKGGQEEEEKDALNPRGIPQSQGELQLQDAFAMLDHVRPLRSGTAAADRSVGGLCFCKILQCLQCPVGFVPAPRAKELNLTEQAFQKLLTQRLPQ